MHVMILKIEGIHLLLASAFMTYLYLHVHMLGYGELVRVVHFVSRVKLTGRHLVYRCTCMPLFPTYTHTHRGGGISTLHLHPVCARKPSLHHRSRSSELLQGRKGSLHWRDKVAVFQVLCCFQSLIACSMQIWRRKAWPQAMTISRSFL